MSRLWRALVFSILALSNSSDEIRDLSYSSRFLLKVISWSERSIRAPSTLARCRDSCRDWDGSGSITARTSPAETLSPTSA